MPIPVLFAAAAFLIIASIIRLRRPSLVIGPRYLAPIVGVCVGVTFLVVGVLRMSA
jgi:hypothetical protein